MLHLIGYFPFVAVDFLSFYVCRLPSIFSISQIICI